MSSDLNCFLPPGALIGEASFDTGYLNIQRVLVGDEDAAFELKAKHPVMGSALHIPLPSDLKEGAPVTVQVFYKTTAECTALQWLNKESASAQLFQSTKTHLLQTNSGEEIPVSLQSVSSDSRTVSCPSSG